LTPALRAFLTIDPALTLLLAILPLRLSSSIRDERDFEPSRATDQ
jgi:hypothetical protein